MDINYNNLREGDLYFAHKGLFGTNVNCCGFIIKPFGGKLFYCCEIVDGEIEFVSFKHRNIILIRRPIGIFNDEIERIKFRKYIIKTRENIILKNEGPILNSQAFIYLMLSSIPAKIDLITNTRYFTDVQHNCV